MHLCTLFTCIQDLTRLEVAIPYLPHMCEDALRERKGRGRFRGHMRRDTSDSSVGTSFDFEAKSKLAEMNENESHDSHRDSVAR